jgi:uncharacterized protein
VADTSQGIEVLVLEERWDLTYRHAMGATATRFFNALRERQILTATHCPNCDRALLPPRAFCDRCFVATDGWVECGDRGVLEAFTIVAQSFAGLPEAPYCFGYVRPEGADTAILNYIRGLDLTDVAAAAQRLTVGTPMRVVFAPEPDGRMTDFWFEIV